MAKAHTNTWTDQLKRGLTEKGITGRSIVAIVLFAMIVVVFVLSDLTGRHKGSSSMGSAAEVNGELISIKDFQDEENRLSQYYSQLFGGQFDNEMQRAMLRNEVMNSLVNKSLIAQAAQKEGIYATDAEVRNMIVNDLPYFKKDGVFQTDAYKAILTANRMTPGDFESKIRKDLQNQRSRHLFEAAFTMTQLQKSLEAKLRSSKVQLQYVPLSAASFAKSDAVTANDVSEALAKPEFNTKVEAYYNSNQGQYETKEQVKASHILIKSDAQTDSQARAKAEEILKKTEKDDFGKLASEFSEDPGSKVKKGDLGFFAKGQMVPEFEKAAFELPVGKVSGLVKSNFGYHIIKVTDKKPASKKSLEMVKNEIAKKLLADEKYSSFIASIEKDVNAGQFDNANATLNKMNLKWENTGLFSIAEEVAPGMNSAQAVKLALELTPAQPMAKRLVREGDVQFLIKLDKFEVAPDSGATPSPDLSVIEKQKSNSAYSAWVGNFRKSAHITTNSGLTSQQ